ncbi:N-acetyltransferase [Sphingomonas ginsenosidivorax]|uniref:N-acetyltransferase n=1 Tax=Sphingomonas ginsenosidivorax TaxID=862135 RepID=A0A5C6UDF6_9SPHN|nr:N-acetyltransferase [Sphingomonas ginsenosidivorax]TXC70699.1 N-acetyltransferase [Sphingomonas ginsenosidivorax]
MITIVRLDSVAPAAVEALLDRAFEPGRHRRTAYIVRGDGHAIPTLSFAAMLDGALVGSIQCWPVALVASDDIVHPVVMVGPVAVDPAHQMHGIGRMLMTAALDAAAAHGLDDAMMLIGDPEYYGRFFGFTAERTAGWVLPGPVERHRLLARGAAVPAIAGTLGPRIAAPA